VSSTFCRSLYIVALIHISLPFEVVSGAAVCPSDLAGDAVVGVVEVVVGVVVVVVVSVAE